MLIISLLINPHVGYQHSRCGPVEYIELAFILYLSVLFSYAYFYIFENIYKIKVRYGSVFCLFFGYCFFQLEFMYNYFFECLKF